MWIALKFSLSEAFGTSVEIDTEHQYSLVKVGTLVILSQGGDHRVKVQEE